MFFRPTHYMEAVKAMDFSDVECNLVFSGIHCPFTLAELGITARILEAEAFHAYGNSDLKDVIAGRYGVNPDQVLIPGGGSSMCNFLLAAALLGPGDRALVEFPTYEPLEATIASTGAEIVPLNRPFERGFDLDFDEFSELMRPPVKLVVLCRLHNPSGRDVPIEMLERMAEKAEEIGAYVLVDEVYLDFIPEDIRKPAVALHPRLLTTASLTKVYGLGELRLGWGIGPADLVWSCWRINNVLGVHPPSIPDRIALELFRNGGLERIEAWSRRRSRENLAIVEPFINEHKNLDWVMPDGGITAYVHLAGCESADPFIALLRKKFRTAVISGREFDLPQGFRLGFGCEAKELREGLRRIGLALSEGIS